MLEWLVVRGDRRDLVAEAMAKAWRGGVGVLADVAFPQRKATRVLCVAWPEGAGTRRAARWPEVLTDWRDIYDDALFPSDAVPVVAEEVSGLGADALAVHGAPGLERATVGWFARGTLVHYEHVGSATVAWTPEAGLGRPLDGSVRSALALGGRKLADFVGSQRDADVMDRITNTNRAVGETLIERAFRVLLDADPPPPEEIAGMVARAPQARLAL